MWAVIRLCFLGYSVVLAGYNTADYAQGLGSFDHWACAAVSVVFLLGAALLLLQTRSSSFLVS